VFLEVVVEAAAVSLGAPGRGIDVFNNIARGFSKCIFEGTGSSIEQSKWRTVFFLLIEDLVSSELDGSIDSFRAANVVHRD
jgi:hypothetical protein